MQACHALTKNRRISPICTLSAVPSLICIPRGPNSNHIPSIRHAGDPTQRGAEASFILPTRSCAPSHFVMCASYCSVRCEASTLLFCLACASFGLFGLFCEDMGEERGINIICVPGLACEVFTLHAYRRVLTTCIVLRVLRNE